MPGITHDVSCVTEESPEMPAGLTGGQDALSEGGDSLAFVAMPSLFPAIAALAGAAGPKNIYRTRPLPSCS